MTLLLAKEELQLPKKNKRLAIVIGMHRCGTSVVSRALKVYGLKHGDNLITGFDNEKGHWEDRDLAVINERLLTYIDKSWCSMASVTSEETKKLLESELCQEAEDLLKKKIDAYTSFGFKDPRTTILLEFWHQIFSNLNITPVIILAIRKPTAVITSLKARNNFSSLRSCYLWINYNLHALKYLSATNSKFAIVDYDAMLCSPAAQLHKISQFTDFKILSNELLEFATTFIDNKLDHYSASEHLTDSSAMLAVDLAEHIYSLLKDSCQDPELLKSSNTKEIIQKWQDQIFNIQPLLQLCDHESCLRQEAEQFAYNATNELKEIQQSKSWKLTKPLRVLSSCIKFPSSDK